MAASAPRLVVPLLGAMCGSFSLQTFTANASRSSLPPPPARLVERVAISLSWRHRSKLWRCRRHADSGPPEPRRAIVAKIDLADGPKSTHTLAPLGQLSLADLRGATTRIRMTGDLDRRHLRYGIVTPRGAETRLGVAPAAQAARARSGALAPGTPKIILSESRDCHGNCTSRVSNSSAILACSSWNFPARERYP